MNKSFFVLAAILMLTSLSTILPTMALARTYTVHMIADSTADKPPYRFEPDALTVIPGDRVVFINDDMGAHDVMFDSVPDGIDAPLSPMLTKKGDKWGYTFRKVGTYHYHCHPHESMGMEGVVTVVPAARPKPYILNTKKPSGDSLNQ